MLNKNTYEILKMFGSIRPRKALSTKIHIFCNYLRVVRDLKYFLKNFEKTTCQCVTYDQFIRMTYYVKFECEGNINRIDMHY